MSARIRIAIAVAIVATFVVSLQLADIPDEYRPSIGATFTLGLMAAALMMIVTWPRPRAKPLDPGSPRPGGGTWTPPYISNAELLRDAQPAAEPIGDLIRGVIAEVTDEESPASERVEAGGAALAVVLAFLATLVNVALFSLALLVAPQFLWVGILVVAIEIVWVFRLRSLRRRGIDPGWSYWFWPLR
jgi:hypothetical protein